jgi:hypothetical protein
MKGSMKISRVFYNCQLTKVIVFVRNDILPEKQYVEDLTAPYDVVVKIARSK